MQWEKFKKLDFLCQTSDNSKACVVLFHGYGADANDLASLSTAYQLNESVDWFFPQGVHTVPIGPMMTGRAWFQLRISDFERISSDTLKDNGIEPEMLQVVDQVVEWLNHLGKLYDTVVIGGFSQGAILTSHSFYRLNFKPTGLLLLSGFLIAPSVMPTLPEELKVPFFQSHGSQDQVLPISGAKKLYDQLSGLGLKGQWLEFSGGHEIPMSVIGGSQTFLNSLLSP